LLGANHDNKNGTSRTMHRNSKNGNTEIRCRKTQNPEEVLNRPRRFEILAWLPNCSGRVVYFEN